jgi:hypothetical protein
MNFLEKEQNANKEELIEKVNEDFLDTIKQALHISHGLFFDLTEDELHELKNIQANAYENLKGNTEFNLYPLCIAELYKTILNDSYNHEIEKQKSNVNQNKIEELLDDIEKDDSATKERNENNESGEVVYEGDGIKVRMFDISEEDDESEINLNDPLEKIDNKDITEKIQDKEISDVIERLNNSSEKNHIEEIKNNIDEILNSEEDYEENKEETDSDLLEHVDTIKIIPEIPEYPSEKNENKEELEHEISKPSVSEIKEIKSEPIHANTSDETLSNKTNDINNEGIEIEEEFEDEPINFADFKFFADRRIDD